MINSVLACNVFEKRFYEQRRGMGMGNRIAPPLTIIFLDHVERMTLTSGIRLYRRYIDDVFVMGTTEVKVETLIEKLNSFDPNVSFTMERPDNDDYLPFLNTKVRFTGG
ncbi:hypothetical protein Y032_0597g452 [Ancylostoma ceylanicum]|uniref:Reverse transcriptase domain-containing protein n=1 Tax=Ancylostoma ceylanicum TaxID=53326 RepID=A0A016WP22_9BILA|nr:hypothetical protein Y032_0597g452 [Ancylostoma ceylanicum]